MTPRILTLVNHYLPSYKSGGPVRSLANLVDRLGDEFDFWIVTRDRDAEDTEPFQHVEVNAWNSVGKAKVFYAGPQTLRFASMCNLLSTTPHDVLYLNSFFDPRFTVQVLGARCVGLLPGRPTIVAPRGEFSPGALKLKRWKKASFRVVARILGLYDGVLWQASSSAEDHYIRTAVGSVVSTVMVAPDLQPGPREPRRPVQDIDRNDGRLRLLFLSRITPMKNLLFALEVLREVARPVHLSIVGPVRDERYWRRCRNVIDSLPNRIEVSYGGEVPHREVWKHYAASDLLFLPTLGENFGHVVPEALRLGTPVLISDNSPWRNLQAAGVGWDISLSAKPKFVEVINDVAAMSEAERNEQRRTVLEYAHQALDDEEALDANRELFLRANRHSA